MSQTTTPATETAPAPAPIMLPATPARAEVIRMGFETVQGFEALQRAARLLSASPLVPKEYQGPNGLPSCVIALNMAGRIGADPLMVMQNLYVVHGRPGWSAKFKIATFNQCGRYTSIQYDFFGTEGQDDWGCRAWSIEKATGRRIESTLVTIKMAKAEGWYSKSGSKWQTMPEQMLRYRSGSYLVDTYAPELTMGIQSEDEIIDIIDGEVTAQSVVTVSADAPVIPQADAPQAHPRGSRADALKKNLQGAVAAPGEEEVPL